MTEAQWCWQCVTDRPIRMTSVTIVLLVCFLTSQALAWEALPNIPTGRRSQFLVLRDDGAYKYGYDTGDGHAGKQEGDASNQVKGHYFIKNAAGREFDLKYSSGVQGFVPENLDKIQAFITSAAPAAPPTAYLPAAPAVAYLPAAQSYASSDEGDDNSGDYKPDDSGNYNPDDSGEYKPESPEDTGEHKPENPEDTGEYKPEGPEDSGEYKPEGPEDSEGYKPDNTGDFVQVESNSGDASYNFNIDTAAYKRTESSDASGNVHGSYSYNNNAGNHDLQYIAGAGTGFVARSGSLSKPNGLSGGGAAWQASGGHQQTGSAAAAGYSFLGSNANVAIPKGPLNPDGSYAFSYSTNDHSREESGDASGNVRGRFAYNNAAGNHDLSYRAGSQTGFVVTGGSLAQPNGLPNGVAASSGVSAYSGASGYSAGGASSAAFKSSSSGSNDGSYSYGYSTGDQEKQEDSDANGNVRGRFSYRNSAGSHDLSYQAGSQTGFVVTGGSLAQPNGLPNGAAASLRVSANSGASGYSAAGATSAAFKSSSSGSNDGSYSYGYSTGDQEKHEDSDASGNVRGRFSYRNSAGSHDLSYVAGSSTGFLPTGGSLANPNGLGGGAGASARVAVGSGYSYNGASAGSYSEGESKDDQTDTGDASYNFSFDTPEYTRQESADARGNVRGAFSYRNSAGSNDLSFVAGSGTGFQPTGGSLSLPNGLVGKSVLAPTSVANAYIPPSHSNTVAVTAARSGDYSSSNREASSGDASYNFSFDTDEYKRQESSDASGKVRGSFSYKNGVGNHDLNFVAGSGIGFKPNGGSLATPPGVSEAQLLAGFRSSSSSSSSAGSSSSSSLNSFIGGSNSVVTHAAIVPLPSLAHTKASSYSLGNVKVHTYLPPSNEKHKFGYIFDTQ